MLRENKELKKIYKDLMELIEENDKLYIFKIKRINRWFFCKKFKKK